MEALANLTIRGYSRRMKLSEAVHRFIEERKPTYSKHTIDGYRSDLEQLIGITPINTVLGLDHDLMVRYFELMSSRGCKMATLARKRSCLNEFMKWLMNHGVLASNPLAKYPRIKKPDQLPKPFSPEERDRLLNLPLEGLERVLIHLLYGTGMRVTPLSQLKVGDIEFSPIHVEGIEFPGSIRSLQKGNKLIETPMHPKLLPILKDWILKLDHHKGYDWLLPYVDGRPMARVTIERWCREWGVSAQILGRCNPHRFRHTFATDLIRENVNPKVVQVLMGHSDIKTTMGYARVSGGQTGAAILRLPGFRD